MCISLQFTFPLQLIEGYANYGYKKVLDFRNTVELGYNVIKGT
jgi:hypothetical protein